jgi:hypothetical protein
VRGICSPAYANISRRNLQYPAALPRGFFIVDEKTRNIYYNRCGSGYTKKQNVFEYDEFDKLISIKY